jgi:hypothetical protein
MYATTNGMMSDTMAIVYRVNSLEQLLDIVSEDCRSAVEG